jgi:hypothetical protein
MRPRFPQLAVACTWCHAPIGDLCTNPSTRKTRGHDTHDVRRLTWVIDTTTCPHCAAAPGSPCMSAPPALRTALPQPHPGRETAAQDAYAAQHAHDQQLQLAVPNPNRSST